MDDIAIKAEKIYKYYKLGQINNGTLQQDLKSWFAMRMGKEDPNSKIGSQSVYDKDGFYALSDVSFEIKKGDRVGIIGRNGAGKSTLLKVLSKVTAPSDGWIGVNGRVASLLEVGTGFHPEMTGRENIFLNGAILGMKRSEINEQLNNIIEFSEIEKHIDTPVKRYSSGMYVRLAFAVAAHLNSDILIADEVLAVGDAQFQKKAVGKMSDLSTGQGRTVLFVSHQMNAVKSLCTSGIVLNRGQIAFSGTTSECISYYQRDIFSKENDGDLTKYDNEFCEILEFDVVDSDGKSHDGPIDNDMGAFVKLKFNMKKLHSAFTIGYAVYDKEGTVMYWAYLSDREKNIDKLHLGENEIWGEIPTHLLNEDDYYVYFMCSIHFQEWIVNPEERSPRINISIRGGLSDSPFWTLKRPGIMAPVTEWVIRK